MLRKLPYPVPPFFFPTRTIHVDDHEAYLAVMSPHLDPDIWMESYASATEALDDISSARGGPSALRSLVHRRKDPESLGNELVLDVDAIHHVMYDDERFAMPSVLVADYAMPEMTGLNLLQSSGDKNVGRILLTGQADKGTVISAFNDGLIDRYIEKAASDVDVQLNQGIKDLQWRFFGRAYAAVAQTLSRDDYRILWDTEAMDFIVASLGIRPVEMYLVPSPSGLLFLDTHGKGEFVVIVSDAALMDLVDKGEVAGIAAEDLRRIENEEAVPVFAPGERTYAANAKNYELVHVERYVSAQGTYHLGRLTDLSRFRLQDVVSYNDWLDRREESIRTHPSR
jgi:CheY-like chemotaxis protein